MSITDATGVLNIDTRRLDVICVHDYIHITMLAKPRPGSVLINTVGDPNVAFR